MGVFNRKKKMPRGELLELVVSCVATKTLERIESDIHHMMGYRLSQASNTAPEYLEQQGVESKIQQAVAV